MSVKKNSLIMYGKFLSRNSLSGASDYLIDNFVKKLSVFLKISLKKCPSMSEYKVLKNLVLQIIALRKNHSDEISLKKNY